MRNLDKKNMDRNSDPIDLIKKLKPMEAKKSKAQVWTNLEEIMERPLQQQVKIRTLRFQKWSIAASVAVLVCLSILAVMKFYTKNVIALTGEQTLAYLPDGSQVQLNAKSQLSYHPFWWNFNREVFLNGEGFFKVKKGEKFTVISTKGETAVVGTSFNIFARGNDYIVTCLTGKVKVSNPINQDEIIITPNQMAAINESGKLNANLNIDAKLALDWTEGKFIFTQEPLHKVLAEIALRYGVEINNIENLNQPYTGYFDRQQQIEPILDLVCKPFNLEYKKLSSGEFIIQPVD